MSDDAAAGFPDRLLHAFDFAAELEGCRKEHDEQMRALLGALLEVADSFDRFEEAAGGVERPTAEQAAEWRRTVGRIAKQLRLALRGAAVTPLDCLGQPADPHRHEVVGTRPAAGAAEGTIVEEIVRGYQWGDRVLRVPRVITAAPPTRDDPCK
jgi:molecular chaperone GrpE